ncbi:18699_t:CDS:1, partial [Gigaspora rosea]
GQLPQLQNEITEVQNTEDELQDFINNESDSYTNTIFMRNFIPAPAPSLNEPSAINKALTRIQAENNLISWPQIEGTPISEFNIPGYIACAFPTLYST